MVSLASMLTDSHGAPTPQIITAVKRAPTLELERRLRNINIL